VTGATFLRQRGTIVSHGKDAGAYIASIQRGTRVAYTQAMHLTSFLISMGALVTSQRNGSKVWTLLGWTPGLRTLVVGSQLPCGCVIGTYETWRNGLVSIVDARGETCSNHQHSPNVILQRSPQPFYSGSDPSSSFIVTDDASGRDQRSSRPTTSASDL
jgi:hypothetical protein